MSWLDRPQLKPQCGNCHYWERGGPKGQGDHGAVLALCSVNRDPKNNDAVIFESRRGSETCSRWKVAKDGVTELNLRD